MRRAPILTTELGRNCLRRAIEDVLGRYPFVLVAVVLLPEHWHSVWTLPRDDDRYALRWMRIKEVFTKSWLAAGGEERVQSISRTRHGQRGVWHRRYWEHTVRDEVDLKRCVDYIHWNPRMHGLVSRVCDWKWSTFHRYVREGEYPAEWGGTDPTPGWDGPEWGELKQGDDRSVRHNAALDGGRSPV